MDKLQELQAKRQELANAIRKLAENQAKWTAEDRAKWTELNGLYDAAIKEIADAKKVIDDQEAERKAVADRLSGIGNHQDYQPARSPASRPQSSDADGNGRQRFDDQGRLVSFMEETEETVTLQFGDSNGATRRSYIQAKRDNVRLLKAAGYKPWGEFKSARDFIRAGLEGHQQSHFRDRVHKHYNAVQGMSEGIGADGGFMVMPEFAQGIIDRVYQNSLWSMTDNYPVTGNNLTFLCNAETSRANGSRHGGLRGYWVNEGASITSSKPTMREVSLKLVKLGVIVYLTNELIDDAGQALQQYISRKAGEEFNFMTGDSLVNGTGAGQPLGMLNAPSLVSVAKELGQLAATLETENIEKMYARFYAPNLQRMAWLHNQDILPELNTMTLGVGAGGVPTYLPPAGLSAAPFGMLKGRPLMPTEFNATLGTQGDIIAADLSQMLSISKGGVGQAVSAHIEFLTDQQAIRLIIRLNACPWESAPITPYKGSNTQSSFVTLDARA